jgi:glyoxylase-like metal-dependent hydrolase (beta-lactamase superfamily II)
MHTTEAEGALRAARAEAGIAIEDVRRVFVTHLHPDHIGMGRWHTTEGTGAYEDAEWRGTGVAFYQTQTPNSCQTPQNHFTFAHTGVTRDDGE